MKKIIILSTCLLSAPAFGMAKAFNALCTGMRYLGASYLPIASAYTHIKGTLKPFTEPYLTDNGPGDEKSRPKDYRIKVAGKEIPVGKRMVTTVAECSDHTLSHLLGQSEHPYSITVPTILPLERLTNNDPNNRGLTVPEYQQLLEEKVKKNPVKDQDGALRLYAELIKSATKEEIEGVLQHEKGHGERNFGLRLTALSPVIASSVIGFDRVLMKKIGKHIGQLNNPLMRSATKFSTSALLGYLYHQYVSPVPYYAALRYEEYKADDHVQKEQIPGQISLLQKTQMTENVTMREFKKNGVNISSMMHEENPYYATHPTAAKRIARLQKRFRDQA